MPFELIPHSPIIDAIGWALVHFVWQGMILAIICKVGLTFISKKSSNLRYLFSLSVLCLMFVFAVGTAIVSFQSPPLTFEEISVEMSTDSLIYTEYDLNKATDYALAASGGEGPNPQQDAWMMVIAQAKQWLATNNYLFVGLWFLGVFVLTLSLIFGFFQTQRFKIEDVSEIPAELKTRFSGLMTRLGVQRGVEIFESTRVYVPSVIGWLRPVVLLPGTALTGLSAIQLEAVLAHELAHIRRHDYIINLFQSAVEILLFFHPAMWWVSSQIRNEREHCCDDIAVEVSGDVRTYVAALAELEEMRRPASQLAVAASGGSLLTRVRRLIRPTGSPEGRLGFQSISVLIVILFLAVAVASAQFASTEGEPELSRIFWTERDGDRVRLVNMHGPGENFSMAVSGRPLDIEFDAVHNHVYWTDERGRILRAMIEKPDTAEVLVAQREPILSIAHDIEAGEIYWAKPNQIMKAKLDGSQHEVLVNFLNYPSSLQIDYDERKIYWADMMSGNIQRASLDGSNIETLATGRRKPVGLAIDHQRDVIYWTEIDAKGIFRSRLDGTETEQIIRGSGTPLGLFVDSTGAKLYWTDRDLGTIMRSDMNGSNVELLYRGLENPFATFLN